MKIAFLGTGHMGYPMARRLCEAGHTLAVWNRSPEKAKRLIAHGARISESPAEAARDADFVVTMLADGATVGDVLFEQGVASTLRSGAIFIDMSSITPAQARNHAVLLSAQGIDAIDAPVSGGTLGAEAGTLAIMVGGAPATVELARDVFAPLGRAVRVGDAGAGQLAKLANQMIVGITIGAVAEALLLAERGGADIARVREAIRGGFAESRILEVHGQRMVERDFAVRAAMSVQLKDINNALETAGAIGFDTPITRLFSQLYARGVASGMAGLDHSALYLVLDAIETKGEA